MNLKTILENIIHQINLKETCFEISRHVRMAYNPNLGDSKYACWFSTIGMKECRNDEQYLEIVIKEHILNFLFKSKKSRWRHEILNNLNRFDETYIKNVLNILFNEKKIIINGDYVELQTIEKKKRQLLDKIENATEEELDKLL